MNTVQEIQEAIKALPNSDFQTIRFWITEEVDRREYAPLIEQGQAEIIKDLRDSGVVTAPAKPKTPEKVDSYPKWVNPGTDHKKMYLVGDKVQYNGKVWESRHNGLNSWEPGGAGVYENVWLDITATVTGGNTGTGGTGAPSVEAYRVGKAYNAGDKFTYNGSTYEVISAHTSQSDWKPDAVPAIYKKVA